jgi:autotransporter-associated beta strand protein
VIDAGAIDASNALALKNTTVVLNADNGLVFSEGQGSLGGLSGTGDLNAKSADVYVGGNGKDATYSGNFTKGTTLAKYGGGTWTLQGDMLSLPLFDIDDGAVVFDGAGGTAKYIGGITDQSLTFQNGSVLTVTDLIFNLALTVTGSGTAISTPVTNHLASLRVDDGAALSIGRMDPAPSSIIDGASLTVQSISSSSASTESIQINDPTDGTALTFDNADATTFRGTISDYATGSGSVLKTGDGALSLSGANTYTGLTTLSVGTLQTDNLSGSLLQTSGTFAPGNSPATTVIGGDYTQGSSGTLEIEVGGTTAGTEYDVLNIGGTADLAGNIQIVLIDNFAPTPGDRFTILNYAALADSGFSLILPEFDGNLEWTVERGSTALTLTFDYTNDLDGFREKYGLNTDGSEDFLDWSGNGISNILYLAFGLGDPNEANIDRGRLPAVSGVSAYGDYAVSFVEPSANVGLILTMATSDDMSTWPDLDDMETAYQPVHTETESLDADYEQQTLHFDSVPGEDRRFYRMDVEIFDEEAAAQ